MPALFAMGSIALTSHAVAQDAAVPSPRTYAEEVDAATDAVNAADAAADDAIDVADTAGDKSAEPDYSFGPNPMFDRWTPFLGADYPPQAYLQHQEGRVLYRIDVDAQGRATNCTLTEGTGYPLLDNATCPVLMRDASFEPALDHNGNPVSGTFDGTAVWQIVDPGIQNMVLEVQYHVNDEGTVQDCRIIAAAGTPPDGFAQNPCPLQDRAGPYRDAQGNPVPRDVRIKVVVEVTDPSSDTTTDPAN